jgi:serine/alanine adding enzyme
LEINLFTPEIKDSWDSFVMDTEGATCFHLSGWKNVFEKTYHHKTFYLYATEPPHTIAGVLPLVLLKSRLFGCFLVSLPIFDHVGILAKSEEAQEALMKKAIEIGRQQKAEFIEIRTLALLNGNQTGSSAYTGNKLIPKYHKVTFLLDLPKSSDELWGSLKSKLRSQIKKPLKEGLTTRIGGIEEIDNFYYIFSENMKVLGTPVNSRMLFRNILVEFPEQAKICLVFKDQLPIAGGFTIGFKNTIHLPWASSLKPYSHLSPNMLLYWAILEYACKNRFATFDFGRATPGEGTYKFKEQWGPREVRLTWHYWLPNGMPLPEVNPKNPKYNIAIKIWQKMPLFLTRILGPMIVKNLPQ